MGLVWGMISVTLSYFVFQFLRDGLFRIGDEIAGLLWNLLECNYYVFLFLSGVGFIWVSIVDDILIEF